VSDPRVAVLVTAGCHLCEDACAVVADVCAETAQAWVARDLSEVEEPIRAQWREYVPVVLVDGEVHDIFRVDAGRLREALVGTA
jgi:coenzyme F420-reducing hydrogenase beta subunit